MATNRITPGGATPRRHRAAAPATALLAVAVVAMALLAGCGGGSSTATGTPTRKADAPPRQLSPEKAADAQTLDEVLGRQEAAVDALAHLIPALPPKLGRMAAYFRAQEQEHVDGLVKAMRGLQIPAEPQAETIDHTGLRSDRERLHFIYDLESATIDEELSAIATLESDAARTLLASTVANQAQHLTLVRQALGAGPLASVPVPFEDGTAEAPE
jgi:hypothetical protein